MAAVYDAAVPAGGFNTPVDPSTARACGSMGRDPQTALSMASSGHFNFALPRNGALTSASVSTPSQQQQPRRPVSRGHAHRLQRRSVSASTRSRSASSAGSGPVMGTHKRPVLAGCALVSGSSGPHTPRGPAAAPLGSGAPAIPTGLAGLAGVGGRYEYNAGGGGVGTPPPPATDLHVQDANVATTAPSAAPPKGNVKHAPPPPRAVRVSFSPTRRSGGVLRNAAAADTTPTAAPCCESADPMPASTAPRTLRGGAKGPPCGSVKTALPQPSFAGGPVRTAAAASARSDTSSISTTPAASGQPPSEGGHVPSTAKHHHARSVIACVPHTGPGRPRPTVHVLPDLRDRNALPPSTVSAAGTPPPPSPHRAGAGGSGVAASGAGSLPPFVAGGAGALSLPPPPPSSPCGMEGTALGNSNSNNNNGGGRSSTSPDTPAAGSGGAAATVPSMGGGGEEAAPGGRRDGEDAPDAPRDFASAPSTIASPGQAWEEGRDARQGGAAMVPVPPAEVDGTAPTPAAPGLTLTVETTMHAAPYRRSGAYQITSVRATQTIGRVAQLVARRLARKAGVPAPPVLTGIVRGRVVASEATLDAAGVGDGGTIVFTDDAQRVLLRRARATCARCATPFTRFCTATGMQHGGAGPGGRQGTTVAPQQQQAPARTTAVEAPAFEVVATRPAAAWQPHAAPGAADIRGEPSVSASSSSHAVPNVPPAPTSVNAQVEDKSVAAVQATRPTAATAMTSARRTDELSTIPMLRRLPASKPASASATIIHDGGDKAAAPPVVVAERRQSSPCTAPGPPGWAVGKRERVDVHGGGGYMSSTCSPVGHGGGDGSGVGFRGDVGCAVVKSTTSGAAPGGGGGIAHAGPSVCVDCGNPTATPFCAVTGREHVVPLAVPLKTAAAAPVPMSMPASLSTTLSSASRLDLAPLPHTRAASARCSATAPVWEPDAAPPAFAVNTLRASHVKSSPMQVPVLDVDRHELGVLLARSASGDKLSAAERKTEERMERVRVAELERRLSARRLHGLLG